MDLKWDDSLLTGVGLVDDQHKELIERAAKLEKALNQDDNKEVSNMIVFLENYVLKHFKDEEDLMQEYNYPRYDSQKRAHDLFVEKFGEIRKEFETTGITMPLKAKLKVNVNSWLIGHINTMDKALGEYMQEQNYSKAS